MISTKRITNRIKEFEYIIASIIGLVVILFLSSIFLLPNISRSNEIFFQKTQLEDTLNHLKKKKSTLEAMDGDTYRQTLQKITSVLPVSRDYVSLFSTIDRLSQVTGVLINNPSFQFGVISTKSANLISSGGSAYTIKIDMSIEGTNVQINNFMKALADLQGRIITIDSIQWAYEENSMNQISISGYAYYYPLGNTIASIRTSLPEMNKGQKQLFDQFGSVPVPNNEGDYSDIQTGTDNLFR